MQCEVKDADMKELQQLVAGANDSAWNEEYGVHMLGQEHHSSIVLALFHRQLMCIVPAQRRTMLA